MNENTPVDCSDATTTDLVYSNQLVFWLNGRKVQISNPDPTVLLVEYLHSIGLTGTKVGCGQGGCGACTVMLSQRDSVTGEDVHRAVNACLRPLCAVDGMMVTTTEGIGNVHEGLDPVQHCIAVNNGTQCGFCTPGFVMNAHAFLQKKRDASHRRSRISLAAISAAARVIDRSCTLREPIARLRCRNGRDPEMPDGSIVSYSIAERIDAHRPGATATLWPADASGPFHRQRP